MPTNALISIIVPVYNVEAYLPYCLDSISKQTYSNFEAILVDDGSTDSSGAICDEYSKKDNRFVVIHQENQWLSGARNTGLSAAKGDFFCFVDSDDYIHPCYLEILHDTLEQTGCDVAMINGHKTAKLNNFHEISIKKPVIIHQEELMYNAFNRWSNIVWNKLYRSHLKNIRFNTVVSEDFDYTIRLYLSIKKMAYVDTKLYYYVIRPGSITHNGLCQAKKYIDHVNDFMNCLSYIPEDKLLYQGYCIRRLIKIYLNAIYRAKGTNMEHYAHEQLDGTKEVIKKLLAQTPFIPFYEKVYMKLFIKHPSTYVLFRWTANKHYRLQQLISR